MSYTDREEITALIQQETGYDRRKAECLAQKLEEQLSRLLPEPEPWMGQRDSSARHMVGAQSDFFLGA